MVDLQRVALTEARQAEVWPPDDTEESVLGTNLHQTTITNLRWGLNEIAASLAPPGQPRPWQALGQTMITGLQRPDGSRYTVLPDVFVYRQPIADRRAALALAFDGPPLLVIEVLSQATYENDLDLERGKGYSYARAGVQEYVVLDPLGEFLPEPGRGWRLEEGAYRQWEPDASWRWRSRQIAAAVAMDGAHAIVFTREGRRQRREGEVAQELARQEQEIAELRQRLAERGGRG